MTCPSGFTSFLTGLINYTWDSTTVKSTGYEITNFSGYEYCLDGTCYSGLYPQQTLSYEIYDGNGNYLTYGSYNGATEAYFKWDGSCSILTFYSNEYGYEWQDQYFCDEGSDLYQITYSVLYEVYDPDYNLVYSSSEPPNIANEYNESYLLVFATGESFSLDYYPSISEAPEEKCFRCERKDEIDRDDPTTRDNPTNNCDWATLLALINRYPDIVRYSLQFSVYPLGSLIPPGIRLSNTQPTDGVPPNPGPTVLEYGPTQIYNESNEFMDTWVSQRTLVGAPSGVTYDWKEFEFVSDTPIANNDFYVIRTFKVPGTREMLFVNGNGSVRQDPDSFRQVTVLKTDTRRMWCQPYYYYQEQLYQKKRIFHCPGPGPFPTPEFDMTIPPFVVTPDPTPPLPPPPPETCEVGIWVMTLIRIDIQGGVERLLGKVKIPGFPAPVLPINEPPLLSEIQSIVDVFITLVSGGTPSPEDVRGLYDSLIDIVTGILPPRAKEIFDDIWSAIALEPLWHIAGDECNFPVLFKIDDVTFLSTNVTTITVSNKGQLSFGILNKGFLNL